MYYTMDWMTATFLTATNSLILPHKKGKQQLNLTYTQGDTDIRFDI